MCVYRYLNKEHWVLRNNCANPQRKQGVLVLVNFKQRKQRNFEDIKTAGDIIAFLKTNFKDKKLHIKYSLEKREAKINEYLEDNSVMIVTDPDYESDGMITVYGLLDKYFEIDLKVEELRGPGYFKCTILSLRKAVKGRRDLRFKVTPDKVIATNFKVSKHTIDVSNFKIPTSIKVIVDQFQNQNQKLSDIVKIDVFPPADRLLDLVRKTGKNVFIEDVSRPETYAAINDNFIDLPSVYGDEFDPFMKKLIERGYKSLIVTPVIYINENEQSTPFAYFQLVSKGELFSIDTVLEMKDLSFKLVDRIRDANTLMVSVHQQILDISVGGARIMFTDENLKKYVVHSRGFVFDLVFKLQAPITIYGEVRHSYTDEDGNLFVGVDFAGNSSRKDEMKRFYSIMKPMEVEYKSRLLKEMRQRRRTESG